MNKQKFCEEIVRFFPHRLREYFMVLQDNQVEKLQEIRLRVHRPLQLIFSDVELFLGRKGLQKDPDKGEIVGFEDLGQAMSFLSSHSLYALDEELKQGFITIPGGHRVGFVGYGVIKDGLLKGIKDFSGLNFRITREIRGCADAVLPMIVKGNSDINNTLIISPPRCGKTTLLREIIRKLSDGFDGFTGLKVGVVDERSEIAGSFRGVPRHSLGLRTDILDHCPKSVGMYLLIRSMSPQVIATDEIGSKKDVEAINEAVNAGIRLITTVHARDFSELFNRPILNNLLQSKIFTRYIILSDRHGAGTIEGIYDENFTRLSFSTGVEKRREGYG